MPPPGPRRRGPAAVGATSGTKSPGAGARLTARAGRDSGSRAGPGRDAGAQIRGCAGPGSGQPQAERHRRAARRGRALRGSPSGILGHCHAAPKSVISHLCYDIVPSQ